VGAGGAIFKVSRGSPALLLEARAAIEAGPKRSRSSGIQKCPALICFYDPAYSLLQEPLRRS
jgi:hypothetical protein